uniref:Uncharacterized protein n=2 Tax=Oryza TaxID=4527 RepID=Q6ZDM2_ORYSJ|nr:hypothetical protein [Oryza sativa Japonica Group]
METLHLEGSICLTNALFKGCHTLEQLQQTLYLASRRSNLAIRMAKLLLRLAKCSQPPPLAKGGSHHHSHPHPSSLSLPATNRGHAGHECPANVVVWATVRRGSHRRRRRATVTHEPSPPRGAVTICIATAARGATAAAASRTRGAVAAASPPPLSPPPRASRTWGVAASAGSMGRCGHAGEKKGEEKEKEEEEEGNGDGRMTCGSLCDFGVVNRETVGVHT